MRAVDADHPILHPVADDDRDRAGLDDKEVMVRVALLIQSLPRHDGSQLSDRQQAGALLIREPRKRAVTIGRLAHARPQRLRASVPGCAC